MAPADLSALLVTAEALAIRLRANSRRLDDLSRAIRDESWHADLPAARPEEEKEREHAESAERLLTIVDDGARRLRATLGTSRERTSA